MVDNSHILLPLFAEPGIKNIDILMENYTPKICYDTDTKAAFFLTFFRRELDYLIFITSCNFKIFVKSAIGYVILRTRFFVTI